MDFLIYFNEICFYYLDVTNFASLVRQGRKIFVI